MDFMNDENSWPVSRTLIFSQQTVGVWLVLETEGMKLGALKVKSSYLTITFSGMCILKRFFYHKIFHFSWLGINRNGFA